jgi:hypothetical protein
MDKLDDLNNPFDLEDLGTRPHVEWVGSQARDEALKGSLDIGLLPTTACPENGQPAGAPGQTNNIPGGHLEQLLEGMPPAGATAEQENKKPASERWEPKVLNARHREIMRRLLEGANYLTIADEMGIHHQTVMLVATSAVFKTELTKMEASADFTVVRRADDLANEALDNLKVIMRHSRSDANRRAASMDILGIAGYSKIEKRIVGIVSAEDVIKELNKRRRGELSTNGNSQS